MSAKPASPRRKHTPLRTCVACRQALEKRALVRIVRGPEGVRRDPTGKANGRGAYLHARRSCWDKALESDILNRALNATLTPDERAALAAFARTLPDG